MFAGMSKVTQGSLGLSLAITHFSRRGHVVSLPLNDNQPYDLVVDIDGVLHKVQVKTSGFKHPNSNYYFVMLQSVRSNKSRNVRHLFDKSKAELLFIATEDGLQYLIPSSEITATTGIVLSDKYSKYLV